MELFDNTFHQEVVDVLGYDNRVVMIMHETGEARGTPYDNRAVYLHEVRDGKWTSLKLSTWILIAAADSGRVS
jgi:ketosteroid isomerase-like protein